MNNHTHFVLQGKGGVGKSFAAFLLAQYLLSKPGANVLCADTDPTNQTFSSYQALKGKHIKIMTPDLGIDRGAFDDLLEMLCEHEGAAIVDNGASSFLPMMGYIREIDLVSTLNQYGKELYIHVPLIAGEGMEETLKGLQAVLEHQSAPVIVWENELYGPIVKNGKAFTESKFVENYRDRIKGVIRLQQRAADTFGATMHKLTTNKLTFDEAQKSKLFIIADNSRLFQFRQSVYKQLDTLDIFNAEPALGQN